MAYYTHTVNPIGSFVEKEYGNYFEWSINDDSMALCEDFHHKIWVTSPRPGIDQGYRYGTVKKTVAYVCVDEDEFGLPVVEKWYLKKCQKYPNK